MYLFVFGLGYTAGQFIEAYRERFAEVGGTFRSSGKARAFEDAGVIAYRFDGDAYDPRILDRLAGADAVLVSIPPAGGTDPVLDRFSDAMASAPRLRRVG